MQGNRRVSSKTFGSLSPLIPFGDGHTLPPSLPLWGTPSESEAKITLLSYAFLTPYPKGVRVQPKVIGNLTFGFRFKVNRGKAITFGDRKPYLRFKVRRTKGA